MILTKKVKIAKSLGVHSIKLSKTNTAVSTVDKITNGVGVDAAIISSSSSNNDPIELASKLCRKRGSVVLIGVADLKLNRNIFYGKELNFQVSCSYGPGRYDKNYEEKGIDYPIGYVRWTENRNKRYKINKDKKIEVEKFKSKTFHIEDAKQAYEYMLKNRNALGIIVTTKIKLGHTKLMRIWFCLRRQKSKKLILDSLVQAIILKYF